MSNNNKLECDKIWQSLEDADIPKVWVQLLFSDTDRPAGQRTLGVAIVEVYS